MAPLETNVLEPSSLLELNNFVQVFKGLAFYTANRLKYAETASKKLKQTLEETKRDIVGQVLITAAPWFSHFGTFTGSVSTEGKEEKTLPFNLLMK